MKNKEKLVSYLEDGDLYYEVLNTKNKAVARFHENSLGLYTTKWWYVRVGDWALPVPPDREDVVMRALVLLSDLDLTDQENKKKLVGWRKTK